MLLNQEQIKEIIPHREPFLLVDEVLEMEAGKSITAVKYVKEEEYYFQGHFPGNPVMPGVLIMEALAQVGAVAILSAPDWKGRTAYFAGIDKAKFRRKVVPGDVLTMETKIIKCKGPIGVSQAVATVDGQVVAQGQLTFAIG